MTKKFKAILMRLPWSILPFCFDCEHVKPGLTIASHFYGQYLSTMNPVLCLIIPFTVYSSW